MQQFDQAKRRILDAVNDSNKIGCKYRLPEFIRLKGLCLLAEKKADLHKVENIFLESLNLARQHKAKLWELRTANSLARVWGDQKERQKAYDLLFPVYDWYTQGFDTADLIEAKELLTQLQ